MRRWWSDARHFQIVALSSLLLVNFTWIDFGAKPLYSALAILSALATQAVCSRLAGLPNIDLRSPLITGLSLSLLLRADAPWLPALAGVIAIASKFIFRLDGKHIWNPAGFAIVVLLFTQHGVWISPGQWGTSIWLAALLVFFAILVLQAAQRSDIALFFLGSHAALLVARAVWLGDPLAIPLHQLQSGSLLIFAFFMISDPRTAPDSRLGRLLFAVGRRGAGTLSRVLHANAAGALCGADCALPAHAAARPDHSGKTLRMDPTRSFTMKSPLLSRLKAGVALTAIVAQLAVAAGPASAFCGFYVAQADAKLFNKSSKVVLTRNGQQTAITMASDYEGEPSEFALVIPVPSFIKKDQISVVDTKTIDHLDAYTAPRLVEYFDPDPCEEDRLMALAMAPQPTPTAAMPAAGAGISRRQGRGALRRRRIRRLDPVGGGQRRLDPLADRQRLQDSARRRAGDRQLHQAENAFLHRQGELKAHAGQRARLSAAAAGALRDGEIHAAAAARHRQRRRAARPGRLRADASRAASRPAIIAPSRCRRTSMCRCSSRTISPISTRRPSSTRWRARTCTASSSNMPGTWAGAILAPPRR